MNGHNRSPVPVQLPWELTSSEAAAAEKISREHQAFAHNQTDFTPDGPTKYEDNNEVPSVITPDGQRIYVVAKQTTLAGTLKVLAKYGFDRFRRLH